MDKRSMHVTDGNKHKSELDKFKIFYELATPTSTERNRLKRISRRRNDA